MNSRGQIATTITWTAAFFVIFFMALIFLGLTVVLSKKQQVSVLGGVLESSEYAKDTSYTLGSFEQQRAFMSFMETPRVVEGRGRVVKDILAALTKNGQERDILEKNVRFGDLTEKLVPQPRCFGVSSGIFYWSISGIVGPEYSLMSERGNNLTLINGEKQMNLRYYFGGCGNG